MQYVIHERNNDAIICYPAGDRMQFVNRELAKNWAINISTVNAGVFEVIDSTQAGKAYNWKLQSTASCLLANSIQPSI